MNIVHKFKQGLQKSSSYLKTHIIQSLTSNKISDEIIEEIETVLISADIGLDVTNQLINKIKHTKNIQFNDSDFILKLLASEITEILKEREGPLFSQENFNPHVLMFVGVNGSGKTTTIGKLIYKLKENNKILVVASDTFRAAAVDQLKKWSNKYNVDCFESYLNQDPASVAFKACEKAKNEKYNYVLVDTAGRLSNNTNLINQMIKIKSVIQKIISTQQLNSILVLDGTNGSNMLSQVEVFKKAIDINGLIITKLDGTAKGGAIISIAKKYQVPIHFIGLGEKENDLHFFDAKNFSYSLLDLDL
jgi:fused signal recognition particle receptor